MWVQPDSESGQWRNFQLLLSLSVSVFVVDLAGGSAAEFEMRIEAAPQLGSYAPGAPSPYPAAGSPGKRVGIVRVPLVC